MTKRFGGKSRACDLIARHLGTTPNYIEPFAGSLAYLLSKEPSRYETVNDLDCYVANFWRAVTADPEAVAFHADWPVNEACLTARHRWLCAAWRKEKFRTRMLSDPYYYDARVAGWWAWGLSCWIGAGWCAENSVWYGPRSEENTGRAMHHDGARPSACAQRAASPTPEMMAQSERGTAGVRPAVAGDNKGVHQPPEQRPCLSRARDVRMVSEGVGQKRQHLHNDQGVTLARDTDPSKKIPTIAQRGSKGCVPMGAESRLAEQSVPEGRPHLQRPYQVSSPNTALIEWMQRLAERLRYVRVCCGDWSRIMGKAVLSAASPCAILLDPPYSAEAERHGSIYSVEDLSVAHAVREWCIENGDNPNLRIALCGYEGEGHDMLVSEHGWSVEEWKASGGYGRIHAEGQGRSLVNRHRERIWFSPHCLSGWETTPLFQSIGDSE